MNQQEYALHCAIVKHLRYAFPQVVFTHVPARVSGNTPEERKRDMHFKKQMGLFVGCADLLCFWHAEFITGPQYGAMHYGLMPIQCGALEIKVDKGRQESSQKTFEFSFTRIGGRYGICKSVKDAHTTLKKWGVTPKHDVIIEPKATWDEITEARGGLKL